MKALSLWVAVFIGALAGCSTPEESSSRAVVNNNPKQLEHALARGARPDSALKEAVKNNREELVKLLLGRGANPNACDAAYDFSGPAIATNAVTHRAWELEATVRDGDAATTWIERMRLVDSREWSPTLDGDWLLGSTKGQIYYLFRLRPVNGMTLLHWAVTAGNPEIVKTLLNAGATNSPALVRSASQNIRAGMNPDLVCRLIASGGTCDARYTIGRAETWIRASNGIAASSDVPAVAVYETPIAMVQRLQREAKGDSQRQQLERIVTLLNSR